MIWLPGVLSQGGSKKYTWAKYTCSYVEVFGAVTNKTMSFSFSPTLYHAKKYTLDVSTGLFTLPQYSGYDEGNLSQGDGGYVHDDEVQYTSASSSQLKNRTAIYEIKYTTVPSQYNNYTVEYSVRKITASVVRGALVDEISSPDPDAYPENGIQGGYWYVRYSDTPITWERYAVSQTAVEGSSTRATGVYNKYLKVGTEYSIENGEFAVTTTQSLRIRTSTSSFSAPYTILAGGTLSLQSSSQTTGGTVRGPMLGKLTRISGSSSNMYADFIPYTVGDAKGSYIDIVTSYNPYEYPDDGAQDGYWYVKIS